MLRRPLAHTRRSSRSKTLKREVDAKKFLISVEHSKDTNTYIDPSRSKVKTGPFARDSWLVGQAHLKPSTRARYANILDHHIVPRWGDTPLYAVAMPTCKSGSPRSILRPRRCATCIASSV